MKTKVLRFEFPNGSRPPENYTIVFGDYVLVQWSHSGSPYWSDRITAEQRLRENHFPGSYIVQSGTVQCVNSGCHYTDEEEFMQCMRMLRAQLVRGEYHGN